MLKKRTWLVQRLLRPWEEMKEPTEAWKLNKDGKFSDSAVKVREGICLYDYMGSAEFEFGSIGEAVKGLIKDAKSLTTSVFEAPINWETFLSDVKPDLSIKHRIYVLCRKEDVTEVTERATHLLSVPYHQQGLKESMRQDEAILIKHKDKGPRIVGWFELDNGYYFFTNKKTWQYITKLYTGKLPSEP